MNLALDHDGPIPLYHQIAEAIRYRIATGALRPGDALPPLREAAAQWGVNLHTVRRAYAELTQRRLVETRHPLGTRVLGPEAAANRELADPALGRFLASTLREAHERFGMTAEELAARLLAGEPAAEESPARVFMVECSETQAADLARQVEARWRVRVEPWSLDRPSEPPVGHLVATYFHYNDVRSRWPGRFASTRFVAIHPDPGLVAAVRERARGRKSVRALLCEREPSMADNIAADLERLFAGEGVRIVPRLEEEPGALLAARGETGPVLFSPRVWAELSPAERAHPRAVEVRYVVEPNDLASLGRDLHWAPR